MQAQLIADLKSFRLMNPPLMLTVGPMPADASLNVGDVITVDVSAGSGSQVDKDVVLLHRHCTFGLGFNDSWLSVPLDLLYPYTIASVGTGAGYFKIGTSTLDYGRLYY